jgi:hypothetical protein
MLTPFGDVVAWLDQYAAFKRNGDLLHYLFAPHNEHPLVTIRLLTVADVAIFGGRGFAFIGAALASMIGILALLMTELRRDGEIGLSPGIVLTVAFGADGAHGYRLQYARQQPLSDYALIFGCGHRFGTARANPVGDPCRVTCLIHQCDWPCSLAGAPLGLYFTRALALAPAIGGYNRPMAPCTRPWLPAASDLQQSVARKSQDRRRCP